jgi:serine/threonine protein kinase
MTGQTSQVYEAIREGDPQKYALKILLPDLSRDREQIGYIKNEYAVGNTMKCERIVWAHEMGTFHGGPYLTMEFFPFPNLKFYIQQTPEALPPILSTVIEQSAEALAYMHGKGWLHRDIKPDNFLVSPQGQVKLIDFALAQKPKGGLSKLLARKQKIQGTRSYMSPEAIRGQPLDARADIYSFGCTLHELVSGKCPFTGSDTQDLLMKHLRSLPPPVTVSNKNVTPEFAELVQRMLAKKRDDRPKSMDDFLLEFRRMKLFKEPPRPMARQGAAAE